MTDLGEDRTASGDCHSVRALTHLIGSGTVLPETAMMPDPVRVYHTMPLISDPLKAAIKREVPCLAVLEARGHAPHNQGANLRFRCPLHAGDDTPSLNVTPATNEWHCFGCNAGGDVIKLVMDLDRLPFRRAVETILEAHGATLAAAGFADQIAAFQVPRVPKRLRSPLPCPLSATADDAGLSRQVVDYYHAQLRGGDGSGGNPGRAYLAERGLDSRELIERFSLGWSDRTLGVRIPAKPYAEGAGLRDRLERLGWFRAGTGHEHFRGSVVVPIFGADLVVGDPAAHDPAGEVVGCYGRKVTQALRVGVAKHTYLPGPHRGVWNIGPDLVNADGAVVLCEALLDAMSCWVAGLHHVTAAYGVNGFTPHHLAALQRHRAREVFIAYDHDDAGNRAAAHLADQLIAQGFNAYRVTFPPDEDANGYLRSDGPAALAAAVQAATWLGGAPRFAVPALPPAAPLSTAAPTSEATAPPAAPASRSPLAFAAAPAPAARSSASPASSLTAPNGVALVERDGEVWTQLGARTYRIRGLSRNRTPDALRITLRVSLADELGSESRIHIDALDLYQQRLRQQFTAAAAAELAADPEQIKTDLGRLLLALEWYQVERPRGRAAGAAGANGASGAASAAAGGDATPSDGPALSETEHAQALTLAKRPDLLDVIVSDLTACGLVGETLNKRAAVLAVVSRLLDAPLALLVQSSSAAGKTTLMDAVLRILPPSAYRRTSAVSNRALYYLAKQDLRHRVLAIAEEDGASGASYPLKLLQSDGYLDLTTTQKNEQSGKLEGVSVRVEGPIMLFTTTTAPTIDPELRNRCLVLTVDESAQQTAAIHAAQRAAVGLGGFAQASERERLIHRHQAVQRILARVDVRIPEDHAIRFRCDQSRLRRDYPKVLTLIRASALLHQHQRERRQWIRDDGQSDGAAREFIIATDADVRIGLAVADAILGRSLDDLPPQTRALWDQVRAHAAETAAAQGATIDRAALTRRSIQAATRWSYDQLRVHLERLVELEYLTKREQPGQVTVYRVVAGIDDDRPQSPVMENGASTMATLGDPGATLVGPTPQGDSTMEHRENASINPTLGGLVTESHDGGLSGASASERISGTSAPEHDGGTAADLRAAG